MELLIWIVIFIVSLAVLIKASDYFTESAEKIGLFFGLPAFIVGVTIVAIGTSLPELVSSLISVFENSSEIVVGNVVGSNIANIFLVLGVAAIFSKKMNISFEIIHIDLPIFISSAVLLALFIWDGNFTFWEGIISLFALLIYMLYTISLREKSTKKSRKINKDVKKLLAKDKIKGNNLPFKVWIVLVISAFFIYLGAKYTIESVINLSDILGIGKEIIAISAVALGTSLPELVVSISAARKGKAEMAIGNVLGSNVFNSLAVMGIPALFGTLIIPSSVLSFGLPVMILATFIYFVMTQDREITKWEGWFLTIFYLVFIGKVFELF